MNPIRLEALQPEQTSPLSDQNVIIRSHTTRARLQTEETLVAGNRGTTLGKTPHHIHNMSQENPFLPEDEVDHTVADAASQVSSVSNDSFQRYQNWHAWGPAQQELWERPFVPPQEIVVTIKRIRTEITVYDTPVPDWLQLPLRKPCPHGPPAAAFSPLSTQPLLSSELSPLTTQTILQPPPMCSKQLRNSSWATETTVSLSLPQISHDGSINDFPPVDRPRRRHQRGSSQAFSIGSIVGQSSFVGHDSFVSSAPTTTTTTSSSHSLSVESFAHTRRANRKLDELVSPEHHHHRSRMMHPLKGEVLHVLDKVSSPVRRLVKAHSRKGSYDLQASEHGCLA